MRRAERRAAPRRRASPARRLRPAPATQRVEQRRRRDRLGQHAGQRARRRSAAPQRLVAAEGGHHEHARRGAAARAARMRARAFDAVHARHLPVQQHQVVRRVAALGAARRVAAPPRRSRPRRPRRPQRSAMRAQHLARRGVVVDDQRARAAQLVGASARGGAAARAAGRSARVKWKRAALARLAVDPDARRPSARPGCSADRQAQAGAAVAARGRASAWVKGWNRRCAAARRHADAGVAHLEAQLDARRPCARRSSTPTTTSPRSVNLTALLPRLISTWPQPQRIADQRGRQVGGDVEQQLQALLLGLQADQVGQVVQHVVELEVDALERRACRPRSSRSRGCR